MTLIKNNTKQTIADEISKDESNSRVIPPNPQRLEVLSHKIMTTQIGKKFSFMKLDLLNLFPK